MTMEYEFDPFLVAAVAKALKNGAENGMNYKELAAAVLATIAVVKASNRNYKNSSPTNQD